MRGDLTATMRLALDAVDQAPGTAASELPGGAGTIEALMRRNLVEVQGEEWRVFKPAHLHVFHRDLHIDGCHFYSSTYTCACGVGARSYGERSVKTDGYSMVWMEPTGGEPCARCDALIAGARPRHEVVIGRPVGYRYLESVA